MRTKLLQISLFVSSFIFLLNSVAAQEQRNMNKIREFKERAANDFMPPKSASFLNHTLKKNFSNAGPTQSTIDSRLIAYAEAMHDGVMFVPRDSMRFFYSGNRHHPGLEYRFMYDFPNTFPDIEQMPEIFIPNVDSLENYQWDSGADMRKINAKIISGFDEHGNKNQDNIFVTLNGIDWINAGRTLYDFDGTGKLTSAITQNWSGTVWENSFRRLYTYNSHNKMTEETSYYWLNSSSSWKENERTIATYEGSKISSIISQGYGNGWENDWRYSMIYDGDKLTDYYEDYWDYDLNKWEKYNKQVYTYNSSNQLTSEKFMFWNENINDYSNDYRVLLEYEDGKNSRKIYQDWSWNNWVYTIQESYIYSGNSISEIHYAEYDIDQFHDFQRTKYMYNSHGQPIHVSINYYNGTDWEPSINDFRIHFYYENFSPTALFDASESNGPEIYPNPASDYINVNLQDQHLNHIKIVDITGKVVFETQSNFSASTVQIPVNHLPNGVYILHLESGNQTGTKKFVVRH